MQTMPGLPAISTEPIVLKPKFQRLFQEIAAEFCSHAEQQYLIIVDCFADILRYVTEVSPKIILSFFLIN